MSHQIHFNSKRKSGKHLSYSERQYIERIYTQNQKQAHKNRLTQKEMAALIGISEATLSRELKRGAVTQLDTELIPYTSYAALVAHQDYDYKASNKGPGLKIGDDHELAQTLERHLLGEDEDGQVSQIGNKVIRYSPDAVIMKLNEEGWPTETRICTRTLYNYIESDLFCASPVRIYHAVVNQRNRANGTSVVHTRYRQAARLRIDLSEQRIGANMDTGRWIA